MFSPRLPPRLLLVANSRRGMTRLSTQRGSGANHSTVFPRCKTRGRRRVYKSTSDLPPPEDKTPQWDKALESNIKSEMQSLECSIKSEMQSLRSSIKSEMQSLESRMQSLNSKMLGLAAFMVGLVAVGYTATVLMIIGQNARIQGQNARIQGQNAMIEAIKTFR